MAEDSPVPVGNFTPVAKRRLAEVYPFLEARKYSPERVEDLKVDFLRAFESIGYRVRACQEVGIAHATLLDWIERDPDFADILSHLEQLELERHRAEASRRAIDGVDTPVFWQGQEVATVKKYSDILLIVELKRRDPQYRDRAPIENNVDVKLYQGIDDGQI